MEWAILEHTHDNTFPKESAETIDPMKLAESFLKVYETNEFRIKAEEKGKQGKEFSKDEVRDRIVALRETRNRRKSGELPTHGNTDTGRSARFFGLKIW